jgi:FkbM family methyltransferase
MKIKRIGATIPDRIYPVFAMPFWLIHPRCRSALVVPSHGIYHIIRKDCDFWLPSPKAGQRPCTYDDHGYERFYKIRREDIVLDAGAYIGMFTKSVVNRCKKVICIEPYSKNIQCLRLNCKDFNNIQIVPKALSDKKEKQKLTLTRGYSANTLVDNIQRPDGSHFNNVGDNYVDVDTLDNIVSELGLKKVDFIKMDIEGGEIDALKGAEKTLQKTKYVAIATYHIIDGEKTTDRIRNILEENGFVTKVDEEPMDVTYGWKPTLKKV